MIRILDLLFVTRDADGSCVRSSCETSMATARPTLRCSKASSSGLLDQSDLDDAASVIDIGSSAGILVFENRWAAPFTQALRSGGAELVAAGYIPQDAVVASLDATDR